MYRGGDLLEGVIRKDVQNTQDASSQAVKMVTSSSHFPQLRAIIADGRILSSHAKLNPSKIHRLTGLPLVAVFHRKPPSRMIRKEFVRYRNLFLLSIGLPPPEALRIVSRTTSNFQLPEPLRLARMTAKAAAHVIL